MSEDKGTCFVIAPIGEDGSDIRRRSDQVLRHILAPAAEACGYKTERADQILEPGIITSQVIQHIVDDPMVIADLTDRNPNVFYELALRHALKKPVVQIIRIGETIPFDVAASRTVYVDHQDLDRATEAKDEIIKQIQAAERNPGDVDTPISVPIELQNLRQSDDPAEKRDAEIIAMLQGIRSDVSSILAVRSADRRLQKNPTPRALSDLIEAAFSLDRLLRQHLEEAEAHLSPEIISEVERLLKVAKYFGSLYGLDTPSYSHSSSRHSAERNTLRSLARRRIEPEPDIGEPIDVDDMPF